MHCIAMDVRPCTEPKYILCLVLFYDVVRPKGMFTVACFGFDLWPWSPQTAECYQTKYSLALHLPRTGAPKVN